VDVSQEAEMLRNVPLFSGLSAAELKLLAFTSQVHCFAPGETLMRQGDPADCAYVILEG
jgi:CRP/FNR family transcriptional regulator, cyclic AMP receptor protein